MLEVVVLCAGAIFALELWRRHLVRTRALPRWVTPTVWGLFAVAAGGLATAWVLMDRAFDDIHDTVPSEKAARLAEGISGAMTANAFAIAALACATILLGVTALARPRR